jgi:hypothetical protein
VPEERSFVVLALHILLQVRFDSHSFLRPHCSVYSFLIGLLRRSLKLYVLLSCCRKIRIPTTFPLPIPGKSNAWHPDLFLWVGPDGCVIPKDQETTLYLKRQALRTFMEKPWAHLKWTKDNRLLGNPGEFDLPEYDPKPMEASPYAGD